MVAMKEKDLLLDTLNQQTLKIEYTLLPEEKKWLGTYKFRDRRLTMARPFEPPNWRLRSSDAKFQEWWRKQGLDSIFFDGASKGNPGLAAAGGVIYSQDGTKRDSFSWGLG